MEETKMSSETMFCYQCEQTANGKGCTKSGVCGKKYDVANSQDILTAELINLASAVQGMLTSELSDFITEGIFITLTNVNFDIARISEYTERVKEKRIALGGGEVISSDALFDTETDEGSLKSTLLFGLRGMAAYLYHVIVLGYRDESIDSWLVKGLTALTENHTVDEWLGLLMEFGQVNLACMALLDRANTESYGNPIPTNVPLIIEKGPFIIISGHDLHDLQLLLEQTQDKGVNVYTHGEMLPTHAYPQLKKYPNLKGNFGTAWQNQQSEFASVPAPILFTTNCLMPPKDSYSDRVYTTAMVAYPEIKHVGTNNNSSKDFSGIIQQAIALGGYTEDVQQTGINGGKSVTTGFGRQTILDNAPTIIDAVKAGAIKHFLLVGGCDGAKPGRNYYTDIVKQAPDDTVILTLACGKYRFNDLVIGSIGPFPRILDVGQCNDAYGAVQVAVALAGAFECDVNDLPLTLVLSWYEQKAVCILLSLLSLGIKNIYIGPSLPAFFTENVLNALVSKFALHPISSPEDDLKAILQ
jgi:hydroxylamine reductase